MPVLPGTSRFCGSWYNVPFPDPLACSKALAAGNIDLVQFRALNKEINEDCSNIMAGYAYCLGSMLCQPQLYYASLNSTIAVATAAFDSSSTTQSASSIAVGSQAASSTKPSAPMPAPTLAPTLAPHPHAIPAPARPTPVSTLWSNETTMPDEVCRFGAKHEKRCATPGAPSHNPPAIVAPYLKTKAYHDHTAVAPTSASGSSSIIPPPMENAA